MIKGLRSIDIEDFSGGLNTKAGPGALADNEYAAAQNVYLWERGIAKRKGFTRYNDSARISGETSGAGIAEAPFVDSGTQIIAVSGDRIKRKITNAWEDITGSVTVTPFNPVLFTMQNNCLVGVNGVDPAWYSDGGDAAKTLTDENIPTAPSVCESFRGRLFLAQGRRLCWSEYMGNWNKAFRPDTEQYFSDTITGLKVLGDNTGSALLVFTRHQVWGCIFDPSIGEQVGGAGTFRFEEISAAHGCASPYSVQECVMEDGTILVIWADTDGLKAITPNYQIVKISEAIQPDWDSQNFGQLGNCLGVHYKPRRWYMLFFADGDSSAHNRVLIFDLRVWRPIAFFNWSVSCAGIVTVAGVDALVGCDYSGYWNQYDNGQNDNGAAIDGYFFTKAYNGKLPFTDKGFLSAQIEYALLGNYTITIMPFYGDSYSSGETVTHTPAGNALGSFVLDQDVLARDATLSATVKEIRGRGRIVQLRVSNALADEPFRVHKLHILYKAGRTTYL